MRDLFIDHGLGYETLQQGSCCECAVPSCRVPSIAVRVLALSICSMKIVARVAVSQKRFVLSIPVGDSWARII